MTTKPGLHQPASRGPTGAAVSRRSSLFRLMATAGLALTVSVALIELLNSRPRVHCTAYAEAPAEISLIAHAGGGLEQGDYSNSRQALDLSLAHGLELFELDFIWTSDSELAIGHDWQREYRYWNRLGWSGWLASFFMDAPSSREFETSTPKFGLTRMSLDTLLDWLRANPGRIVTDFKTGNLEGLALIASQAGDLRHRFVPQIYEMSEYQAVRDLGYDEIIFTTYRLPPSAELFNRIDTLDLFAVTVPASVATDAAQTVSNNRVFTHTINSEVNLPVAGYYTDCLIPPGSAAAPSM